MSSISRGCLLGTVEEPDAVNRVLLDFLAERPDGVKKLKYLGCQVIETNGEAPTNATLREGAVGKTTGEAW